MTKIPKSASRVARDKRNQKIITLWNEYKDIDASRSDVQELIATKCHITRTTVRRILNNAGLL